MKNYNNAKYVFEFSILQHYADAFNAIVCVLDNYGIISSQNYADGIIVGKWNPIIKGKFGASINVWNGNFQLKDNGSLTNIVLTLSGGSEVFSAKCMCRYFYKRLSCFTDATKPNKTVIKNGTFSQIKNALNQKPKSDFLTQLDETLGIIDAIIPNNKSKNQNYNKQMWDDRDEITYYPDEDHESHDYESDGYCNECDNYIDDMM